MNEDTKALWAIVELFGHARIAGRISEHAIGGQSFVRVDVPEIDGRQAITKLFGTGAIYAITFCDEETAAAASRQIRSEPYNEWSARRLLQIAEQADGDDDGKPF